MWGQLALAGIGLGNSLLNKPKKPKSAQKQYYENLGFIRQDMAPFLQQLLQAQGLQGQLGGANLALAQNAAGGSIGGGAAGFGGSEIARALSRGYSQSQAATAGAKTNFDANMGFHQQAASAAGQAGTQQGSDQGQYFSRMLSLIGQYMLTNKAQQQGAQGGGFQSQGIPANPYGMPNFGTGAQMYGGPGVQYPGGFSTPSAMNGPGIKYRGRLGG